MPLADAEEESLERRRILCVDDDETIQDLLCDSLEPAGLEVVCAANGPAGLAAFDEQTPDLVLLDVDMPGMDGFEVCRALRERPRGRHLPIVMVTARDDVASIQRAYEVGATDFVTKPFNWLILQQRLRYMLRSSALLTDFVRSQQHLGEAQEIAGLGSFEHDLSTGHVECSDEFRRLFGLGDQSGPLRWEDIVGRIDEADRERVDGGLERTALEIRPFQADHGLLLPGGARRVVELRARPIADEQGRTRRIAGIAHDITQRKQAEEEIRFLAFHDPLTRLGNRRLVKEQLSRALARRRRHGGTIGVILVDIDQFKRINEGFGHSAGDRLLQRVADRIVGCIRETDILAAPAPSAGVPSVSRFASDEFVVVLEEIGDIENVTVVAQRLLSALQTPLLIRDQELVFSGSLGIALSPDHGGDPDELLRKADVAMFHAKRAGGNAFRIYDAEFETILPKNLALEAELRRALERAELTVHYQPKVDLRTDEITGFEALVRWIHPERGLIPPNDFIPVAERTGTITALGEYVLRTACNQARAWQDAGLENFRMAVNFAPQQFRSREIVATVQSALRDANLSPQVLEVEITESTLMENQSLAIESLEDLREIGVGVSLDDFGTGYSSLSYLKRFPVDTVKIDRAFVRDLPGNADDAAITRAIISMAHSLKLAIVAEGVETEEQRAFLAELGCDQMQGYLYSPPVAADAILELIRKNDPEPAKD